MNAASVSRSVVVMLCAVVSSALCNASQPREVDLGRLAVGERVIRELVVENPGGNPLTLADVTTSCDCAKVLAHPNTVLPGKSGVIRVEVRAETPGDYAYEVHVRAAGSPSTPYVSFSLLLTVPGGGSAARDAALYVTAESILSGEEPTPVLVDVRGVRADDSRMPGVLRVPLHAVKATRSLRTRELVLVDEGWGSPRTEAACRRLQEAGYLSVKILNGGVQAWHGAGGAVAGGSPDAIATVTAAEYLAANRSAEWVVVDVGRPVDGAPLTDADVHWPYEPGRGGNFASVVESLVAAQPDLVRVLVVDDDVRGRGSIAADLGGIEGAAVFFLEGGREGLARAGQLTAVRHAGHSKRKSRTVGGRRPKPRRPCGSCS